MKAHEIVYEAQAEEAEELEPDATVDPDQSHSNDNRDGNGNGDEANEGEGKPIDADDELGIQHPEEEEEDLVGEEEGEGESEVKGEMNGADTAIVTGEDAESRPKEIGGKEGEVEISPQKRARSVSVHLDEEEVVGKRVKMDGGESSVAVLREPADDAETE